VYSSSACVLVVLI